jgi:hypothetical protein
LVAESGEKMEVILQIMDRLGKGDSTVVHPDIDFEGNIPGKVLLFLQQ